jgi:hypothetical protein
MIIGLMLAGENPLTTPLQDRHGVLLGGIAGVALVVTGGAYVARLNQHRERDARVEDSVIVTAATEGAPRSAGNDARWVARPWSCCSEWVTDALHDPSCCRTHAACRAGTHRPSSSCTSTAGGGS